ncbi:MFS general substrate transporter [Teratosphaeria nubilosa]|uniref:MFS general substrate transporter n=1 Tax=Teratosphaeria nubilosa TaxID=161662 RepID=A0A6G1KWW2_9PEZI|nr:MFS general substrate transporter [Teratosphaeria nubilosa]
MPDPHQRQNLPKKKWSRGPVRLRPSPYSKREQWIIVSIVALAGLFSPLPANIFFPAIPQLAADFHRSTEDINLTVTIYLVFQGISPMLWGPLGDRVGRRPIFLLCLVVLIGSSIGLALTPTSAYWLLMFLRCFQSGGSASTIALGAGVISDIADIREKGTLFGAFNVGPMLAPVIGPLIGGALSQHLGWRSIFWTLTIASAACLMAILLFLPETMQLPYQDDGRRCNILRRPVLPLIKSRSPETSEDEDRFSPKKASRNPFLPFTYPDVLVVLSFTSIIYAVNYSITATISSSFQSTYPFLTETDLGLCYLPTGAGMLAGSVATGRILDWKYATYKTRAVEEQGDFPIEQARLSTMPIHLIVFVASVVGWAWSIQQKTSIAVPLVLQVILGWTAMASLNTTMTLMIDIMPAQSSGITACVNFARCSLGAVLVSVIDMSTSAIGVGWTYVILGGCSLALLPLFFVEMRFGPRWRVKRAHALDI